jgi:hypothetical protein
VDPITLQNLLDELSREGGNLAEYLAAAIAEGNLTIEQAEELSNAALDAFGTLQNADARTAADVATMTTLVETAEAVRVARQSLVDAATAEAEQIAELAARIAPPVASETPAEETEEGSEETEPPAEETEGVDIANAPVVDLTEPEPALVAALPVTPPARRPRVDLGAIARRTTRPEPTQGNQGTELPFGGALVASVGAANLGGPQAGQSYGNWQDLARVGMQAFGSMSEGQLRSLVASADSQGMPFRQNTGLASFKLDFPDELTINDPSADSTAILAHAASVARAGGAAMVAANGWCSPSETMYNLCDLPCSLDGILSLPEVNAPRGGLRFTKGLDFAAIYNGTGYFHFTEAQMAAIPRPDKPCMEIPCADFEDHRLDVDGLCITGDIMQSRTYPELVAQFMQGAMCAHAHRVNAFKLAAMDLASADQGSITQAGYGAVANVLYAIELQIQAYRYRGRRAQEGSPSLLELVAPYWVKGVLRADIANRNAPSGVGNPLMVTDADMVAWFASRGVAVRYVYDWQDLETVEDDLTGDPVPVTDYPNNVEFMLYEAGSWIVPTLDLITLESIYDSTLIKQNKFTALFTEQAFTIVERCFGSLKFTVPVCANGNTGAQVAITCAADIAPTGATAGEPGVFTPAGALTPQHFADLSGITASPATAWTAGEFVLLGDGSHAYWNSTAWTVGIAP